jgi:tetratricopeptide (TPR) repeat protein
MEMARDYYNIGNAYSDLERLEDAAQYYRRALELDPSINQAAFNLARAALETGEDREALRMLRSLEDQDSENLLVKEMLGFAWYRIGDSEKAAECYRASLEIDGAHIRSLYNLTLLEKDAENWTAARGYLERLLELEDEKEYRLLLGELAAAEGDAEGALLYYEDLLIDYEGDAGIYQDMKDLYLEVERYGKALEMLDLVIASEKDENRKGEYYFEKCSIEIETLQDIVNGRKDLKAALDAGFRDQEKLDALAEKVQPAYRLEVKELIREALEDRDSESEPEPSGDDGDDALTADE